MNITLTLTEEEAGALHDLLGWAGDHIGDILDAAGSHDHYPSGEDQQAQLDGNDKEIRDTFKPLFSTSQRVSELIEAETTEKEIMGKPRACPQCGEDNDHDGIKEPYLLEMTGADAHCDHEVEYNYSCSNCGCRFDEVWAYSRKEITHRGKQCECDEPERETREGGRSVICTVCGRDADRAGSRRHWTASSQCTSPSTMCTPWLTRATYAATTPT